MLGAGGHRLPHLGLRAATDQDPRHRGAQTGADRRRVPTPPLGIHAPLTLASPDTGAVRGRVEYCPADELHITGLDLAPFDSTGSIYIPGSLQDFGQQLNSPYYHDVLAPDELRFNDPQRSFAMMVTERCVWSTIPFTRQ
jgi:hypothetical protein